MILDSKAHGTVVHEHAGNEAHLRPGRADTLTRVDDDLGSLVVVRNAGDSGEENARGGFEEIRG